MAEQTITVTVEKDFLHTSNGKSRPGFSFRIKLHNLTAIR